LKFFLYAFIKIFSNSSGENLTLLEIIFNASFFEIFPSIAFVSNCNLSFISEISDDSDDISYFFETYYNGQFGQLKQLLSKIKKEGNINALLDEIDQLLPQDSKKIKNWIIKNS
jgi:hypothetical protein